MARSSYIYIATYAGAVLGTFTVKHELMTGLGRFVAERPYMRRELLNITRHYDGMTAAGAYVNITGQFEWPHPPR